jgi:hypothetical protein
VSGLTHHPNRDVQPEDFDEDISSLIDDSEQDEVPTGSEKPRCERDNEDSDSESQNQDDKEY